jgi:hypothetical protein
MFGRPKRWRSAFQNLAGVMQPPVIVQSWDIFRSLVQLSAKVPGNPCHTSFHNLKVLLALISLDSFNFIGLFGRFSALRTSASSPSPVGVQALACLACVVARWLFTKKKCKKCKFRKFPERGRLARAAQFPILSQTFPVKSVKSVNS